jgi:hypothetical protein
LCTGHASPPSKSLGPGDPQSVQAYLHSARRPHRGDGLATTRALKSRPAIVDQPTRSSDERRGLLDDRRRALSSGAELRRRPEHHECIGAALGSLSRKGATRPTGADDVSERVDIQAKDSLG